MSYDVRLFRREVQALHELHEQKPGESFFEEEANLLPFTPAQRQGLHERLLRYGYALVAQHPTHRAYELVTDDGARVAAALFAAGLYFWPWLKDWSKSRIWKILVLQTNIYNM